MGDELELLSLYVVFPDGSMRELPTESVSFEFASEAPEPAPQHSSVPFEFTTTATIGFNKRAFRMLLGLRRVDGRELLMNHRRRSPHGWRYRDR
ncbi:hypothetical protein [Collinsella intestinalis]|uniref:hypothetical protein n=1 Tax=Collinsella intestinalis TaxID=147207 RepID=UPI0025A37FAA|nr:hypothetical protein [Collinsella intestinalis]MDM8162428.1 hypothetical protein [Collinsella intestinalis]